MFLQDSDKPIVMGGLNQMNHLVSDHIFKQVLWLFDQFRVETNTSRPVVTASPFRFHPLEKIAADFDTELPLPLLDKWRYRFVEQLLVPAVNNFSALISATARP